MAVGGLLLALSMVIIQLFHHPRRIISHGISADNALKLADIRIDLAGTVGRKFEVVYWHDQQTQHVSGVLPGQILFKADAFNASVSVPGPGQFGFEVYRNNDLIASGKPNTVTNLSREISIEGMAGGRGTFLHSKADQTDSPTNTGNNMAAKTPTSSVKFEVRLAN
jgi:hypothetical protein